MISIDDFLKVEMKVGLVTDALEVLGSEKLIRLTVSFGEETRTIFTGVKKWYGVEFFKDKRFVFATNLEPKKIMEEESQGMIMAAVQLDGKPIFIAPLEEVEVGSVVR